MCSSTASICTKHTSPHEAKRFPKSLQDEACQNTWCCVVVHLLKTCCSTYRAKAIGIGMDEIWSKRCLWRGTKVSFEGIANHITHRNDMIIHQWCDYHTIKRESSGWLLVLIVIRPETQWGYAEQRIIHRIVNFFPLRIQRWSHSPDSELHRGISKG